MLPLQTKIDIRDALPDVVWMPMGFPDYPELTEWGYIPQIRWPFEGHDDPSPPYEQVTLQCSPAGVVEDNQPVDERFAVSEVAGATGSDDSADVETVKGRRVYDVLNIQVVAGGSETLRGVQLNSHERAHQLTRGLYRWLLNVFPSRPLDAFDDAGNAVDPDPEHVFADELSPPLRIDAIAGRAPTDVTGQVTDLDADESQYDAAVELHYVDTYVEGSYQAADASVGTEMTLDLGLDDESDTGSQVR